MTHTGWQVHQLDLDRHLWRSPHGLRRETGPAGTTAIDELAHWHLAHSGALDRALDAVERAWRPDAPGPAPLVEHVRVASVRCAGGPAAGCAGALSGGRTGRTAGWCPDHR